MDFFSWSHGILNLGPWQVVIIALVMTHITGLSMTLYLHRCSAHRAIDLHPIMQHFFRFWLWLTTATNTKEWTAIHRKHHAKCETPEDPHSPVHYGLSRVFFGGALLYRKEARNKETLERYGKGCPDDWIERKLYEPYTALGIFILLAIDLLAFGGWGALVWLVQMLWVPFWAAGVVNGIGHIFGYRNFECNDNARNIIPLGIIMAGEELHNNHHAYPNSARLSSKPWEFDIGWLYIRLLSAVGLARVRFSKPLAKRSAIKTKIDANTIMAIVNNRFHVMASYTHEVIRPLIHSEKGNASKKERMQLRLANKLLSRNDNLLRPVQREYIGQITMHFSTLNTIYEKRLALQEIWQKIKCNNQRIEALTRWCHEAEQSGIHALKEFSKQLKSYTLPVNPMK